MSPLSPAVLPIALLLAGGSVLLVFGQTAILKRQAPLLALAVLACSAALAMRGTDSTPPDASVLVADPLFAGTALLSAVAVGLILLTLGSRQCLRPGEAAGLLLLGTAGLLLTAAARHLTLGIAGVELAWLASLPLSFLLSPTAGVWEASRRRLMVGIAATVLTITGACFLAAADGTTLLGAAANAEGAARPAVAGSAGSSAALTVAAVLMLAGLGVRLGAAPFHAGTLAAARELPAMWPMWESSIPRTAAVVLWLKLMAGATGGFVIAGSAVTLVSAVLTLAAATVLMLREAELRQTLAAAAMGLVAAPLIVLAAAPHSANAPTSAQLPSPWGIASFAWASDVVMLCGLLAVLTWLARSDRPVLNADDLRGLLATQPAAAACILLFLAGLAGLPLLPGFWSQSFAALTAWQVRLDPNASGYSQPHPGFVLALTCNVMFRAALAVVGWRIVSRTAFDGPLAHPRTQGVQLPLAASLLIGILAVGVGILPQPLVERLRTVLPDSRGSAPPNKGGKGGVALRGDLPEPEDSTARRAITTPDF